jgi:enediyne biosynthesis thioesterase
MRSYEYPYVVGFEDTNVVGNVYYANHIRWQGRCREMFLRDHAPKMLEEIEHGLALVTLRVSCEYFLELGAFDELVIRMRLAELLQNRMTLVFEYWLNNDGAEQLAARGEQELACMLRQDDQLEAVHWPPVLVEALEPYRTDS